MDAAGCRWPSPRMPSGLGAGSARSRSCHRPDGLLGSDGSERTACLLNRGAGESELAGPAAFAVDSDGNVWIVDAMENCVKRFSGDGVWIETLRSSGAAGRLFSGPQDVAVAADGGIVVADALNSRIVKLSRDGESKWTTEQIALASGETEELSEPCSLAAARDGTIWLADRGCRTESYVSTNAASSFANCLPKSCRFRSRYELESASGSSLRIATASVCRRSRTTERLRPRSSFRCRDRTAPRGTEAERLPSIATGASGSSIFRGIRFCRRR